MSAANESFENPVSDDLSSDGDTTTIETVRFHPPPVHRTRNFPTVLRTPFFSERERGSQDPPAGKVAAVDSTVSKDLAGAGDVLDTYTSPLVSTQAVRTTA